MLWGYSYCIRKQAVGWRFYVWLAFGFQVIKFGLRHYSRKNCKQTVVVRLRYCGNDRRFVSGCKLKGVVRFQIINLLFTGRNSATFELKVAGFLVVNNRLFCALRLIFVVNVAYSRKTGFSKMLRHCAVALCSVTLS